MNAEQKLKNAIDNNNLRQVQQLMPLVGSLSDDTISDVFKGGKSEICNFLVMDCKIDITRHLHKFIIIAIYDHNIRLLDYLIQEHNADKKTAFYEAAVRSRWEVLEHLILHHNTIEAGYTNILENLLLPSAGLTKSKELIAALREKKELETLPQLGRSETFKL